MLLVGWAALAGCGWRWSALAGWLVVLRGVGWLVVVGGAVRRAIAALRVDAIWLVVCWLVCLLNWLVDVGGGVW